jgi:hypothetical protein
LSILELLASLDQTREITKLAGSISVCKHGILTADMPHAVSYSASLASILLKSNDTD